MGCVTEPLMRRSVVWVQFDPTPGQEQADSRPAVVLSSDDYLDAVPDLAIVVPVHPRPGLADEETMDAIAMWIRDFLAP